MVKTIIAGNWKLNKTAGEAKSFIDDLKAQVDADVDADVVVIPPALFVADAVERTQDSALKVGAQNCYSEDSGAFTGETSPAALSDLGVDYVVLGHSERREIFKETDEEINAKVKAALDNKLTPILCVGETLEQREANEYVAFITEQLKAALKGLDANDISQVVFAYEPIWAIGTGKTASAQDAEEVCAEIRQVIAELTSEDVAKEASILYGGSVKAANAKEILSQDNINGVLVGGASLEVDSFTGIIDAVK
ncbi:triose-phosphate isomerase [Aerococcus sanguinicola]|uniref:Triosephosphate isomerase n=1 Tax=Aerococcus sanguinicola TaxID=119206 RepID=A0A120I921_9LACT|nr:MULTISPECIES: triose-phosphate isomerase [Aerococcus]AMB93548.1 triose-phosphate isomerase [Aerococcus sanguinicola]OFT97499.1 triose-phosphate isomerase [Aerococcus sp. HMSC23C02]PKZ21723.1 triose-phosphate isomerase [Aerococcus sanguinicola]